MVIVSFIVYEKASNSASVDNIMTVVYFVAF